MSALSKILRSGEDGALLFWCPGCDGAHRILHGQGQGPRWGYNGNPEAPTFTPSIRVQGVDALSDDEHDMVMRGIRVESRPTLCHSFVTDGRIQFLGDCTHALAGQTVDLPVWGGE